MSTTATTAAQAATLPDLAKRINEHHQQCEAALNAGLQHALAAGRLLAEAKGQCQHGEWQPWLKENFAGSDRTGRAYMQIAKRWPEIESKRQRVATLSYRDAVKLLAEPKRQFDPSKEATDEEKAAHKRWVVETKRRLVEAEAMPEKTTAEAFAKIQAMKCIADEGRTHANNWAIEVIRADRLAADIFQEREDGGDNPENVYGWAKNLIGTTRREYLTIKTLGLAGEIDLMAWFDRRQTTGREIGIDHLCKLIRNGQLSRTTEATA